MGPHLSEFLVENEFGITVSQELAVDHGIFSWFPYLVPSAWDLTITPLAVNMMRAPLPTHQRLRHLGEALRAGVEAFGADQRVVVIATGGMSRGPTVTSPTGCSPGRPSWGAGARGPGGLLPHARLLLEVFGVGRPAQDPATAEPPGGTSR